MKRTTLGLFIAAPLAGLMIACGASAPPPAPATATAAPSTPTLSATPTPTPTPAAAVSSIEIASLEDGEKYSYDPGKIVMKAGELTVKLVNKGVKWPHTLAIKNPAGGTDLFRSDRVKLGDSADLKFTLSEPGTYQIYCTVTGHETKGMVGTLTIVKG
ncbi:MAG: cupredoxin domain-containing protein [Chloroflexota bacterium]